ncbi:hypothetical protein BARVI_09095 [Barnesiella viscericola DSM 18177]|uniref:Uncharacterized protein n=1 Tax=Barnesiella viscericola DSM 18177 TaxID=880074 RepID=W0EXS5_9BACT|nr:hypothetical protein BARVI_09095 [Barnesiella viscericola DSM 18177]
MMALKIEMDYRAGFESGGRTGAIPLALWPFPGR